MYPIINGLDGPKHGLVDNKGSDNRLIDEDIFTFRG